MSIRPEQFVINHKGDSPDVVHQPTCGTIQHQVQQAERIEQADHTYEFLGRNADGDSIIRERRGSDIGHYSARFVTVDDLSKWPRRYRRCRHCSPNVPDSRRAANPDVIRMKARSIIERHLGRDLVTIGPLRSIRLSADGYELVGDEAVIRVPLDGDVEYRKS